MATEALLAEVPIATVAALLEHKDTRLGRDASYDEEDLQNLNSQMRRVSSSNVYSYTYQPEHNRMGILYVTFLQYVPKQAGGDGEKKNAPSSTYAYYNFPLQKFKQFEAMAAASAGGAVCDYCRIRHSVYEHQHTYRLIQVSGDYVPRKATSHGYRNRTLLSPGSNGLALARSTLPKRRFISRGQLPTRRAFPNRGEPNRGAPSRGKE